MINTRKMSQTEIAGLVALMGKPPGGTLKAPEPTPSPKPEFTEEELALIRSLPKAERKRKVAELKAKYAQVQK